MTLHGKPRSAALLCALLLICLCLLCGCENLDRLTGKTDKPKTEAPRYLRVVDDEPDIVDFQRTTLYYTVALNVFDRLVETETDEAGNTKIVPSLAESWTVSDDGLEYTFRLRSGVVFSNGQKLTAEDVHYTLVRLLTHPDSRNREIAAEIAGAEQLMRQETDELAGFAAQGDSVFTIRLAEPFPSFLACLSTPGASIMNKKSAEEAGDAFGQDPAKTIGTGPFILEEWVPGKGMTLRANPACWRGAPGCDSLELLYVTDEAEQRLMFERGELDILDLDKLGDEAEYFIHGDMYENKRYEAAQVDISYIALNQSIRPLDDVRVRQALQMALDRQLILDVLYGGRGTLENGIFPHGLKGFNPDLEPIRYDPEEAKRLLAEAGYADGFDLQVIVNISAGQTRKQLMQLAASMWEKIGVRATVSILTSGEFMTMRTSGKAACYTATWSADYNDPDNFIYSFFGSEENTVYRSLCYPDGDVIRRVQDVRGIPDEKERLKEYAALEKKIIREDASWIPLFSRTHLYVTGERVEHFETAWNGWCEPAYSRITLKQE